METLCPWCGERTPAEPDAQWVYCIHCYIRIDIDPAEVKARVIPASERITLLEALVDTCVRALEALLESPALNLDDLEQTTMDAIAMARDTVQAVQAALTPRA